MPSVVKKWSDRTAGSSKIEHLSFPGDRKWKTCKIKVHGKCWRQKINLKVDAGDTTTSFHCEPDEGETSYRELEINKQCSVNVRGELYIMNIFSGPAGAEVEVECTYEEAPTLKSKTVTWKDETMGISHIEHLYLPAEHNWERFELKLEGVKNKVTSVNIKIIVNGEERLRPTDFRFSGSESKVLGFDLNKKVQISVEGYITNSFLAGAGATVSLIGYYKE